MKHILSAITALCIASAASAFDASTYRSSSVLNSGHWVKISTADQGIHQLTYERLRELGFEHPENVQVYGYGAVQFTDHVYADDQPDDLTPTATYHTGDGRILFFGEADNDLEYTNETRTNGSYKYRRNYYDTRSYYFLSDCRGAVAVATTDMLPVAENASEESHISVVINDEDNLCPIKGGIDYHNFNCTGGEKVPLNFTLRNFQATALEAVASVVYRFAVRSTLATTISTSLTNATLYAAIPTKAWNIPENDYDQFNYPSAIVTFVPKTAEGNVTVTANLPSLTYSYCAFDRALLRYPRANAFEADCNQLVMYYSSAQRSNAVNQVFSGVDNGEVVLWLANRPDQMTQIVGEYNGEARTLTFGINDNTKRVVAFRPEASFPEPEVIGEVAAQDLHAASTPDLLIITTDEFLPIAQNLANLHRAYQNLDVLVVDQAQIFNEFSSGTRDVMAYRRFAKMLYDRNPEKFKSILLFGVGAYDNRCLTIPVVDRLLAYENTDPDQSRNFITCYASDNIFGMLADDYAHSEIQSQPMQVAVGRVPAITGTQAQNYVDKVAKYLENPVDPASRYRALIIAGEGDRNTHAKHCIEVSSTITAENPDFTIVDLPTQLYEEPGGGNAQSVINIAHDQLLQGVGYVSFSGHGAPTFIANCGVFTTNTAEKYTYSHYPFMMFSSCDQFSYDRMQNGLLESMLFNPDGGAIAGVAATRSVYIVYNQHTCAPVAAAFAAATANSTFGSIYLDARSRSFKRSGITRSGLVNNMSYNLGGDPALPAGASSHSAVITAINDTYFTAEAPLSSDNGATIMPLTPATFTGQITDHEGNVDPAFNGTATITILEAARVYSTKNTSEESNYTPLDYTLEYDILAQTEAKVENGLFSAVISTPVSEVIDADHRVVITAVTDDNSASAIATARGLKVKDYNPEDFADVHFNAPVIKEFYLDNLSFVPGDETSAEITVNAVVDPAESGLRLSSADISTRTRLVVDGLASHSGLNAGFTRLDDGTYRFSTSIDGLSEGRHTIELVVANNAGLIARATTDFVVVTRLDSPTLSVEETPARTVATFNLSDAYASNRLIITDINGNTVFSAENVAFPYAWDLTDGEGKPLPNGRYNASVLINRDSYYGHSTAAQLLIVR